MSKKILQDVRPTVSRQRKIVTQVKPESPLPIFEKNIFEKKISKPNSFPPKRKSNKNFRHIALLVILFAVVSYFVSMYFQKVSIVVQSKHQNFSIKNQEVIASKKEGSIMPFEIMVVDSNDSIDVSLVNSSNFSEKASGIVSFYNEYSKSQIKISSGTFISDVDGKTYLTDKELLIPGYTLVDKKIIPGKADVSVTAFLAGDLYNTSSKDFTINAYKKDQTKFQKIYAKAENPLNGGLSGLVYLLDEKERKTLEEKIIPEFKKQLFQKMQAQVPPGYMVYVDSASFEFSFDESTLQSKTPQAQIVFKGSLKAPLLKDKNMKDFIFSTVFPDRKYEENKDIELLNIKNLNFSFENKNQTIDKDTELIVFRLNGEIEAVWHPDGELLKTQVLGIYKKDLINIFQKNEGISTASVNIFPPWIKKVPIDVKKVNVVVE